MIICMATSPINPIESYASLCRILGSQSVAVKSTYSLLGSKTVYLGLPVDQPATTFSDVGSNLGKKKVTALKTFFISIT
jgi:hypothetical protein